MRAGLASLGLRSLDELVGRADLLRQRDMALAKTTGLDLSFITTYAGPVEASSKRIAQCALVPSLVSDCRCGLLSNCCHVLIEDPACCKVLV